MEVVVRKSRTSDYQSLIAFDEFIGDRRIDMERGELLVADLGSETCVGYVKITSNEFFNKPLISIVNTHPEFRRNGVAEALVKEVIKLATWHKVYSTTETSNLNMQSLFKKLGFSKVGSIEGFNDDEEAELVFCYAKSC